MRGLRPGGLLGSAISCFGTATSLRVSSSNRSKGLVADRLCCGLSPDSLVIRESIVADWAVEQLICISKQAGEGHGCMQPVPPLRIRPSRLLGEGAAAQLSLRACTRREPCGVCREIDRLSVLIVLRCRSAGRYSTSVSATSTDYFCAMAVEINAEDIVRHSHRPASRDRGVDSVVLRERLATHEVGGGSAVCAAVRPNGVRVLHGLVHSADANDPRSAVVHQLDRCGRSKQHERRQVESKNAAPLNRHVGLLSQGDQFFREHLELWHVHQYMRAETSCRVFRPLNVRLRQSVSASANALVVALKVGEPCM